MRKLIVKKYKLHEATQHATRGSDSDLTLYISRDNSQLRLHVYSYLLPTLKFTGAQTQWFSIWPTIIICIVGVLISSSPLVAIALFIRVAFLVGRVFNPEEQFPVSITLVHFYSLRSLLLTLPPLHSDPELILFFFLYIWWLGFRCHFYLKVAFVLTISFHSLTLCPKFWVKF